MTAWPLYGLAFGTGALAGLSPCGIGMVPSYVGMVLDTGTGGATMRRSLGTGIRITAGFMALFGAAAALISVLAGAFIAVIPWAAVAVGLLMAAWGAIGIVRGRLGGIELRGIPLVGHMADGRQLGVYGYGVVYGIACLSCSLPLFLSLVLQTVMARSPAGTPVVLLAYTAGLAVVVNAVSVLAVTARRALAVRVRRFLPYVERLGGLFVLASGLYVMWYWLSGPGALLAGRGLL